MRIKFTSTESDLSSKLRGDGTTCVNNNVDLEDSDADHLFYELWNVYGDSWIKERLTAEGWTMGPGTNAERASTKERK